MFPLQNRLIFASVRKNVAAMGCPRAMCSITPVSANASALAPAPTRPVSMHIPMINYTSIRSMSSEPTAFSRKARKVQQKQVDEGEYNPNSMDQIDSSHYELICDRCIKDIYDAVIGMESMNDTFEIVIGEHEISLNLGDKGTFVFIFKVKSEYLQLNSPMSGLLEYKYDRSQRLWLNVKDSHDFRGLVTRDLLRICSGCPNFK
jgi:frataxin-like iron-binding protein CyaY